MKTMQDYIDINELPFAKKCSLEKALRWIVQKQKILDDPYYNLVYGQGSKSTDYNVNYHGEINIFEEEEFQAEMALALNALSISILQDKLIAYGRHLKKESKLTTEEQKIAWIDWFVEDGFKITKENDSIPKKIFDSSWSYNINWSLGRVDAGQSHEALIFDKIYFYTHEILKFFPDKNSSPHDNLMLIKENRGRKPQFEWHKKIYPEILMYIHENGISENQSEMAKEIYSICSQKFGEDETPDIDTIRKLAIAPIVRRYRAGNNSE